MKQTNQDVTRLDVCKGIWTHLYVVRQCCGMSCAQVNWCSGGPTQTPHAFWT